MKNLQPVAKSRFDFASLPRPSARRNTYGETLECYNSGLLSLGFVRELAKYDEVFGRFLDRNDVPRLDPEETC